MQVAVSRITASVGSMMLGSARSTTRTSPGPYMVTARMAGSFRFEGSAGCGSVPRARERERSEGDDHEGQDDERHRYGGPFTTESGDGGDHSGGAPLQEPEHRGSGTGVVGHFAGGEGAGVGADETLGAHEHEEA